MVRLNQNRSKLLLGCGSAALAMGLAMASQSASAQAIQATENVTTGGATRIFTGTGTEDIVVSTPVAVIDWTPDEDQLGNALDFLPTNNSVTFRNDANNFDFAVLNRILPATNGNVTVIDGNVISLIFDALGSASAGGTVAFYSPTGILIGPNATFDVGNLILTTLDPDQASFADFATNGGQLQMIGNTGTTASIVISPGSQIVATPENSYFAVTAAEIQMLGSSSVNGSTAFVAGEQVNLTVSNGLFDIQIPVGTSVTTPIVIDGDVGGPSSTGFTDDNHLIYAVAAAQNDPISMIFRGNLGFQPAASAGIVNGEIILSANYEVNGRDAAGQNVQDDTFSSFVGNLEVTPVAGSIFLEDFISTSTIMAVANEEVQVSAVNGPSFIDGNLLMFGRNFAELTASNGQTFDIFGNVLVSANDVGLLGSDLNTGEADAVAGQAFIDAFDGGTMNITGDAQVTADAIAGTDFATLQSGSATGGFAAIASNGGTLTIGGLGIVSADAIFDVESSGFVVGGNIFQAGTAQIFATQGGQVTIDGFAQVSADAFGAIGDDQTQSTASSAFGGQAFVQAFDTGSSLTFNNDLQISADADAGQSNDALQGGLADAGDVSLFIDQDGTIDVAGDVDLYAAAFGGFNAGGQGGDALGGAARVFVPNGGSLNIGGNFFTEATGVGGDGLSGGNGFGGIAGAQAIVGTIAITGDATGEAFGFGGAANAGLGGNGGDGTGGNAFLQVDGTLTGVGTLTVGGNASLSSSGIGGEGGDGDGINTTPGNGGNGTGGQIGTPNQADTQFGSGAYLLAGGDNGNLTVVGTSTVVNVGIGGTGGNGGINQNGGDGGIGTGGTAQVGSFLGGLDGSVGAGTVTLGDVIVFANGDGGNGGNGGGTGALQGNGGDGVGFAAFFTARAGSVDAGLVELNADGTGGSGHVGGTGTGGLANGFFGFNATIAVDGLRAFANGRGGFGDNQGGAGFGGQSIIDGGPYDLTVNGNVLLDAGGLGGDSTVGPGGEAGGGLAQMLVDTDETTIAITGNATLQATATGGSGTSTGPAATATGGQAILSLMSASFVDIGGILLTDASAQGGVNFGPGAGGDAIGGARAFVFVDNNGALTVGGDYVANASANGGTGIGGGDAFGGVAGAQVLAGSIDFQTNVTVDAAANGGDSTSQSGFGGDGGDGFGGLALVSAQGTQTETGSIAIAGQATLLANGFGGMGGIGDGSTILAGRGGDGYAGTFNTSIVADDNETGGARLIAGGDNGDLSVGGGSLLNAVGAGGIGGNGGLGQGGGDGGDGFGGFAQAGAIVLETDGTVGAGTVNFNDVSILAGANGGGGGFGGSTGDPQGNGGNALGFRAQINANAGTVVAGNVTATTTAVGGDGFNGGTGEGGDRTGTSTNTGGSLTMTGFNGFALGIGGVGTFGVGGSGMGGQAFIGAQDGTTLVNGDVVVNATGQGGNSANGDGGAGSGGVADIAIFTPIAGTGTITGNAGVIANGIGGEASSGFTGGVGIGGEAYISAQAGGSLTFGSAQVTASGQGGSGGDSNGGAGTGGLAYIEAFDAGTTLTIQNSTPGSFANILNRGGIVTAVGIGGNATGAGGLGGTGTGGSVSVYAANGGTVALPADPANDPNSALGFNGIIGRGFGGGTSVEGGTGGLAVGGEGRIEADAGTITSGTTIFSVFSFGGSSLDTNANITGGDAIGGDREVLIVNGGTITAEFNGGVSGGVGGNGSGTGNGGNASGGSVAVNVFDGTLNAVGNSIFINGGNGGSGATGGDASGGPVDFNVIGGTVNILPNANGVAQIVIGGQVTGGNGDSQGGDATGSDVNVLISEGSVIGGSMIVDASGVGGAANGTGGTGTGGNAFVVGTFATIGLEGEFLIAAEGFGGDGANGGNAEGGFASLDLASTNLTMTPDANGVARILIEASGNAGTGTNQMGDATSGTAQLLLFDANLSADELFLASEAEAQANTTGPSGGNAIAGLVEAIIEGNSTVDVGAFALVAPATSSSGGFAGGGEVALTVGGTQGAPTVDADELIVNADAFGGSIDSVGANFPGSFSIQALSGVLNVVNLTGSALGDSLDTQSVASSISAEGGDILVSGNMTIDVLDDFNVTTGQGSIIGGPSLLDPSAQISITSGGTVTFAGDNDNLISFGGDSLSVTSNDIVIEDGARLGAFSMAFVSTNSEAPAILGGGGTPQGGVTGEGYSFIGEELARLEVGTFTFSQPVVGEQGANDPDLIIRDITASGSLDDGAFSITASVIGTGGIARVEGVLAYVDADVEDTLSLIADGRIEVVTPGGIGIVDLQGNPTGTLFLGSNTIWVADSDLIALLQDDPFFTGRNDQLAVAASGSDDPLGYLRAGGVNINVGSQLLVRNTGTSTEQGGILVGDGGLSISGGENTEGGLDVFAYGARLDSSTGALVTGEAFYGEVNFDNTNSSGTTPYIDEAEFNDCLINTGECAGGGVDPDPDPDPDPEEPSNEEGVDPAINNPAVIEAAISIVAPIEATEAESDDDFGIDFPGLVEAEDREEEDDIEDPVASGGDSSLYGQGNSGNVRVEGN